MTTGTLTQNAWNFERLAPDNSSVAAVWVSKKTARIAGALYLGVGVFGGFAQGFVGPKLYAARDAATSAMNVATNSGLVRLGVVADLVNQVLFIVLALTLYGMLKHVRPGVARVMVAFVAIAVAIASLNAVFLFEALQVATDASYATALSTSGANALIMTLLDMQHYGLLIAQIFFGLWLAPLGYLAYKSQLFPKVLAGVLILGAVCYLIDVMAALLFPDFGSMIHGFVVIPCAVAEIWMVLYLLVIGVRTPRQPVATIA
ncbi:MAG: hypothetical protein JWR75_1368 [Devosia sp.]|nr:hypothetical protein [Devosia sp.]